MVLYGYKKYERIAYATVSFISMSVFSDFIVICMLFVVLGIFADFAVEHIKYIGKILRIRLFAFGILLGLITSLPEMSLGINAMIDGVAILSIGNLLGGIVVIFGLVLGVSLLFQRRVETDGEWKTLIPTSLVIFSPVLFGIDGLYSTVDGLCMILLYSVLIFYLYRAHSEYEFPSIEFVDRKKVSLSLLVSILGIVGVVYISHWIIISATRLLVGFSVDPLIVGLIVFSLGTNLPEITIAITSWRKKTQELSLSHLLSSAFTNVLVLGVFASIQPIAFGIDRTFLILALFVGLILMLFSYFYLTERHMNRIEGGILFGVYVLFVCITIAVGLQ